MRSALILLVLAATAVAGELLVVAPRRFHADLAPFIAHKKADKKIETRLVALEEALKTNGVDDPERLKRFLFRRWKKGTRYVLLVGDGDTLPVRYMVLDREQKPAFDYAFYPSDLYYADVAKQDGSFESWNARKEGFHARYFGEVRGEKNKKDPINYDQVDYLPELAVGRWPISNQAELKVIIKVNLAFARSKPTGRAALIDIPGWVDARAFHARMKKTLGPQATYARAADEKRILELFGQDLDLLLHSGHGETGRWHGCLSITSLKKLPHGKRTPVVFSVGCSTAAFAPLPPYDAYVDENGKSHKGTDHGEVFPLPPPPPHPLQVKFDRTGLGEKFLLYGAVAYIGCNTGSQPCALTLMDGFVRAYPKTDRLGDCWVAALRHYHKKERLDELEPTKSWYPPSIFFQGMKFMLFGDPSLRVR